MNAALDEAQAGIKITRRNINNIRYADDTTLMAESKKDPKEKKRNLMKMKQESEKVGLKLQDYGIQSHHFMANRWGNNGNSDRLYILGLQKSLWMVNAAMKLKDICSLEEKTNLDSVLKSKNITLPTMVHIVKITVFQVVMYGWASWTIKKAEHQKIDAFELWCWRRLLRVP